jgi:uncharacterized membrane protein
MAKVQASNGAVPGGATSQGVPQRAVPQDPPVVRSIGAGDVLDALREGWDDFLACPTQLLFLGILYPVIGILAAFAASGRDLMPLLWPLVSGLALVGPVAAIGIYELSRRREQNLPSSWLDAFDVLKSPNLGSIVVVGVVLLAIFVAWLFIAQAIYDGTLGRLAPANLTELVTQVFNTPEGWQLLVVGNTVGFFFALAVLMLTSISFPLLLDRPVGPGTALRTSIRASLVNPFPMALWGAIVAALLAIGSLPLFVGLAVVMPVLGHATWHLYRKTVPD